MSFQSCDIITGPLSVGVIWNRTENEVKFTAFDNQSVATIQLVCVLFKHKSCIMYTCHISINICILFSKDIWIVSLLPKKISIIFTFVCQVQVQRRKLIMWLIKNTLQMCSPQNSLLRYFLFGLIRAAGWKTFYSRLSV